MNPWTISQVAVFVLGFAAAFIGEKFSISILTYGGISLFGVATFLIGLEAAITRRIVLGRRRYNESYLGIAAYAQGVQFMLIGIFFIGASFLAYLDTGRDLFLYFVRRPGTLLATLGIYCLMQAIIVIGGYEEEKQGTRWIVILNLITSRWLPGVILTAIGIGLTGLGLIEMVAPNLFDAWGGGFLEMLYGLR